MSLVQNVQKLASGFLNVCLSLLEFDVIGLDQIWAMDILIAN